MSEIMGRWGGDDINTPRGLRCFDDAYGHNVMS